MQRMILSLTVIFVALLLCVNASNAEPTLVRGAVYKFVHDGVTTYTNVKPKNVDSVVIFTYVQTSNGVMWHSLGYGSDGAETLVNYREKKSEVKPASIWVLTNYPKVTVLPGTQIALRSFIDLWKVNCDTEESWSTERVGYTEAYGTGDVVGQWKFYQQPSSAIPGTVGAAVVKSACPVELPTQAFKSADAGAKDDLRKR